MVYWFVLLLVLLVALAFLEAGSFIRYDGKMKRGLKVGAGPLPSDVERFLRHLSNDFVGDGSTAFIKKREQVVLIQPIPRFFYRGFGVWYVGYVDLSVEEPRIEYRMPISIVPFFAVIVGLMVLGLVKGPVEETMRAAVVLAFLAVLIVIGHATSKAKVLRFIRSTMRTYQR